MDKKLTGILSYFSIVLWLIAFLAGDKENAKFHLNQGLVLNLASIIFGVVFGILSAFDYIGWIFSLLSGAVNIVVLIFAIMGIVSAAKEEEKPLPIIGSIQILK